MKATEGVQRAAHFSRCRQYRYALWRRWQVQGDYLAIIGLNPSTADHQRDDPTIRRCMGYARDWGYDAVCIVNLFAYRATYPNDLKAAVDPVGPKNDQWLRKICKDASLVLAAWGNDGDWMERAAKVVTQLPDLHCLDVNKSGHPAHPLYQPRNRLPAPYNITRLLGV